MFASSWLRKVSNTCSSHARRNGFNEIDNGSTSPTRGAKAPQHVNCAGPFCGGSAARIPILIICVVPTIRCIAAGALTGSVRVHAATSRRSRIGGARCCSASCACRSTSATGTSSRSAAGATGATTSRSATTAAALCQRGRTDGDCCKQRESEYFSYRHAGLHVGVSFMQTANTRIVPIWAMATRSVRCPTKAAIDPRAVERGTLRAERNCLTASC